MVDTTLSSTLHGDNDGKELAAELASLIPSSGEYPSRSEPQSREQAIPVTAAGMEHVKAITSIPISRLAFPFQFNNPSSRRKSLAQAPASCSMGRKFPRIPSPLSMEDKSPMPKPQTASRPGAYRRHHHHGYSRQALLHSKWFWSLREDKWHDQRSGDSETVSSPDSPSCLGNFKVLTQHPHCLRTTRPASFYCDDQDQPLSAPPLTSFPRRGDITALRDPYCVEADRCFANIPTWTLAKILWLHDMHTKCVQEQAGPDTPCSEVDDDPFDEAASEISFDTTTSVGFSDDSDATLVESEAEWEPCYDLDATCKRGPPSQDSLDCASASSSRTEAGLDVPSVWTKDLYLNPPSVRRLLPSYSRPSNWYRRWDLLLELSQTKRRPEKSPPMPKVLPTREIVKPVPQKVPSRSTPTKRISFTRGFLISLKNKTSVKPERPSVLVQESFLNPSHPAAG